MMKINLPKSPRNAKDNTSTNSGAKRGDSFSSSDERYAAKFQERYGLKSARVKGASPPRDTEHLYQRLY